MHLSHTSQAAIQPRINIVDDDIQMDLMTKFMDYLSMEIH